MARARAASDPPVCSPAQRDLQALGGPVPWTRSASSLYMDPPQHARLCVAQVQALDRRPGCRWPGQIEALMTTSATSLFAALDIGHRTVGRRSSGSSWTSGHVPPTSPHRMDNFSAIRRARRRAGMSCRPLPRQPGLRASSTTWKQQVRAAFTSTAAGAQSPTTSVNEAPKPFRSHKSADDSVKRLPQDGVRYEPGESGLGCIVAFRQQCLT